MVKLLYHNRQLSAVTQKNDTVLGGWAEHVSTVVRRPGFSCLTEPEAETHRSLLSVCSVSGCNVYF